MDPSTAEKEATAAQTEEKGSSPGSSPASPAQEVFTLTGAVSSVRRLGKSLRFATIEGATDVCLEASRMGDLFPAKSAVREGDTVRVDAVEGACADGGVKLFVTRWAVLERRVNVDVERMETIRLERKKRKLAREARRKARPKRDGAGTSGGFGAGADASADTSAGVGGGAGAGADGGGGACCSSGARAVVRSVADSSSPLAAKNAVVATVVAAVEGKEDTAWHTGGDMDTTPEMPDACEETAGKEESSVRNAEKDRISTCSFADRIARLVIDEFQRRSPPDGSLTYAQTVLAGVVVKCAPVADLRVVSLGVGTKFVREPHPDNARNGDVVRDMHAEVLARRGFMRYLCCQLQLCLREDDCQSDAVNDDARVGSSAIAIASESSGSGGKGGSCSGVGGGQGVGDSGGNNFGRSGDAGHGGEHAGTPERSIFEQQSRGGGKRFVLRDGITFHLYSSTAPCGNACIRRWARGGAGPVWDSMPVEEFPCEKHPHLHVTAREQGQVALTFKQDLGSSGTSSLLNDTSLIDGSSINGSPTDGKMGDDALSDGTVATVRRRSGRGTLTCSDKIAVWNAVGWQGGLLSRLIAPVYVDSCTIGRKFSKTHCERALCCRLQVTASCHVVVW